MTSISGGLAAVGLYCENEEAAAKLEAGTWKFEPGTYDYVCVAPLARARFEPHVVARYTRTAHRCSGSCMPRFIAVVGASSAPPEGGSIAPRS